MAEPLPDEPDPKQDQKPDPKLAPAKKAPPMQVPRTLYEVQSAGFHTAIKIGGTAQMEKSATESTYVLKVKDDGCLWIWKKNRSQAVDADRVTGLPSIVPLPNVAWMIPK